MTFVVTVVLVSGCTDNNLGLEPAVAVTLDAASLKMDRFVVVQSNNKEGFCDATIVNATIAHLLGKEKETHPSDAVAWMQTQHEVKKRLWGT